MYGHDPHCLYHDEPDLEPWFPMARQQLIAEERAHLRNLIPYAHSLGIAMPSESEFSDEDCEPTQNAIERRAAYLQQKGIEP